MAKGIGGVYYRGQEQSFFNTIEFGLTPFVPFSRDWKVKVQEERAKGKYNVGPAGMITEETIKKPWKGTLTGYGKAGFDLLDQVNEAPASDFKSRADKMAKELGEILAGETSPATKYETTETAELEERILIDWLFTGDHGWKSGQEPWRVAGFDGERKVQKKSYSTTNKEMLDMMATSENEAQYTEYVLHRLAAEFGKDWMEDVQGIEMTKMVGDKFLQQAYVETAGMGTPVERLQIAGEKMARDIMVEYDKIGGTIAQAAVAMTVVKPGKTETASYIANQVLDRLAEITHRVKGNQASYVYQVPLVERQRSEGMGSPFGKKLKNEYPSQDMLVGFIKLTPRVGGAKGDPSNYTLDNINVSSRVKDISDPPEGMDESKWISIKEQKNILDSASNSSYGTFAQWLLMDAAVNLFKEQEKISQMNDAIGMGMAMWGAFQGRRHELLGSSLDSTVEQISRGFVGGMGSVRAVDILTTSEISKDLQGQFEAFLSGENKELTEALQTFYENAMVTSNQATDTWKGGLNPSPSNLPHSQNVWRPTGLYDGDGKSGEGVGAPFFLLSGREPAAFLKFKERVKKSAWIELFDRPASFTAGTQLNPSFLSSAEMGLMASLKGEASAYEMGVGTKTIPGAGGYSTAGTAYEQFYEMAGVESAFELLMEFGEE